MDSAAREGVIRFRYDLRPATAPFDAGTLAILNAWRRILRGAGVLGQTPGRYGGYGFGNVSAKDGADGPAFLITGTQSGGLEWLPPSAFARVAHVDFERFHATAEGSSAPSSEALTHAAIYAADATVRWVFHGHSPSIFAAAADLGLATVPADVPYGTPRMASAVTTLMGRHAQRPLLFVSLGHEDGVFACGADAGTVGALLIATLARALARPDARHPACSPR